MADNKITAALLTTMRPELDAAVAEVAKKYGVTLHFGNARFSELTATYTVNVGIAASDNFNPDKALWDSNCKHLGLAPEDFGKEFCFAGEKVLYRISGYNPNGRTNNIRIQRVSDGKEFITNALSVKTGLGLGINIQQVAPPMTPQTKQPDAPAPAEDEAARKAKMEWDLNCWSIGMKAEDFGKTVVLDGHLFRICGIRPRATVNSVLILDVKKNKEYVSSPDAIKKAWAAQQ